MKRVTKYLYQRNGVYYFRIVVPRKLIIYFHKKEFRLSLRERSLYLAEIKVAHLIAKFRKVFYEVAMSNEEEFTTGFITVFDPKTGNKLAEVDYDGDMSKELEASRQIIQENATQPLVKTHSSGSDNLIQDIFEKYIQEHIQSKRFGSRDNRTETQYRNYLSVFIEYAGNIPLLEIHIDTVKQYYTDLQSLPTNYRKIKVLKDKPLSVLLATSKHPTISTQTRKKYFEILSSFMNWCVKNQYIIHNPCSAVILEKELIPANKKRCSFTHSDLQAIFSSDYFIGKNWHSGPASIREHYRFWLPILAALTGARIGELCDLRTTDIKQDSFGTWYFKIADEIDPKTGKKLKHLKSKSSNRNIPLHSKLIDIGFLDYLRSLKTGLIFPVQNSTKPNESDPGNCGKKMNQLLKRSKVHVPNQKVFHSFRHTFINDLFEQRLDVGIISSMTGHLDEKAIAIAPEMMNTYVDGISPTTQKEVIEQLSWTDLLSTIKWSS